MKSKSTAIVLCLFLGGIGMHKFYLNRTFFGVLYLVFCWTFIPALCSLFDLIGLIFQSDEDFNKTYNKVVMHAQTKSPTEELTALAALFEKNLLSKEEYDLKKTELLKKIG